MKLTAGAKVLVLLLLLGHASGTALGEKLRPSTSVDDAGSVMTERPQAVGGPQWLMDSNDCWQEDDSARADAPGHAVVRVDDGPAEYVGPELVAVALAHVYGERQPWLTVIAFCR